MTKNVADIFKELTEKVDAWREELGVPGTAVGISYEGEHYTHGSGITNHENPLEVDAETLFQIGSITKTYTGTIMMMLVEQGKLDLDAKVRDYIPDFKVADDAVASSVTVKHLLTHTAGWTGDVFTDTGDNDEALKLYVEQLAENPQLIAPDRAVSYNNAAFCVAGRVIEVVTKKRYEDVVKEMIFDKLGMSLSFFLPKDVITRRYAAGHTVTPDGVMVMRPWNIPRSSNPAGGIACSIEDLLKYGDFSMGDGIAGDERLLSAEGMAKLQTPLYAINEMRGSIALSWFISDIGGLKSIGHGGGTSGQISQLSIIPEKQFAFGMVTNANTGGQLIQKAQKWIIKALFDVENPDPEPVEADEATLEEFVGKYERGIMSIDLSMEAGKMQAQLQLKGGLNTDEPPPSPPPFALEWCGDDMFVVTQDGPYKSITAEAIRDDSGKVDYLRVGLRVNKRVES